MNQYVLLIFIYLIGWIGINAEEQKKMSHVDALFPKNMPSLNIKPYIPDNYMLVQIPEDVDHLEFFWAPEGVVENILENEKALHVPIINITKLSRVHSNKDLKDYLEQYRKFYPKGFQRTQMKWGSHEVVAVNGYFGSDDLSCLAFVGLNDPDGTFLMFQLMYSKKLDYGNGNKPSKEDLKFWENFLKKTH